MKSWQPSEAHLQLLGKFLFGQELKNVTAAYWAGPLGEPAGSAVQRFIALGWLLPATLSVKLRSGFRASDLKPLLKERGLRVSGRKDELIERLVASDEPGMTALVAEMNVYECSPAARARAEQYKLEQAEKRATTEDCAFNLLHAHDFAGASQTVAAFEAAQVFPRGMGIDWAKHNVSRDVSQLKMIFEIKPKILDSLAGGEWEPLRIAAGMMALWGTGRAEAWLPPSFVGVPKFDADTAARMLLFASSNKLRLAEYRQLSDRGVRMKGLRVSVTGGSCQTCKKMAGKRYGFEDFPELPHAGCTHRNGCRCLAMPVLD